MSDSFSRYDVYTVVGSKYCYTGTNVLRNRFGIHDAEQLKLVETDLAAIRQNALVISPMYGHFSPNHLCRIHKYLFGDIYWFAGHYRREDIAKGSTRFLSYQEIPMKLSSLLAKLRAEGKLGGLEQAELIRRSAYYFAELNYIHPFREGNGRATREFMRLLFLKNGYRVDWAAVSTDELLTAMEESVYCTDRLGQVLTRCLSTSSIE